MTITEVSCFFNKATPVYKPGETVSGYVQIDCEHAEVTRGIRLALSGESRVLFWDTDEGEASNSRPFTVEKHYRSEKSFDGADVLRMEPGIHCFPFAYCLPSWVPGSFEGKYGYVRHEVCLKILSPESSDTEIVRPFSVTPKFDLNTVSKAKEQGKESCRMTVGNFFSRQSISYCMSIRYLGYVSGEPLLITGKCINDSDKPLKCITAALMQEIHFYLKRQRRSVCREVCSIKHENIPAKSEDVWTDECLMIPTLPPSKLPGSTIIDIQYYLEFTAESPKKRAPLKSRIGMIIGTVPLRGVCRAHLSENKAPSNPPGLVPEVATNPIPSDAIIHVPTVREQGAVPLAITDMLSRRVSDTPTTSQPSTPLDEPPGYSQVADDDDLPPPSYNQSVFGSDHEPSAPAFSPYYVTYHFPESSSN